MPDLGRNTAKSKPKDEQTITVFGKFSALYSLGNIYCAMSSVVSKGGAPWYDDGEERKVMKMRSNGDHEKFPPCRDVNACGGREKLTLKT
ncbi:hypothetical protein ACJRO7_015955 [Eucalyptus globulus]|uniref:Uncharacterized protein n=1 Tax=Eucalyptus globulus TaxID=34317 RepID=A0ABD3L964_EUCGL